jgi:hypothetical protein
MLPGAKPAEYPGFIDPCLAKLWQHPPPGGRWIREIKFDVIACRRICAQANIRYSRVEF